MKKFLIRTLAFLFPILLIVLPVNLLGDAANLFSKSYEATVAGYLLSGQNVTNVYNYNERELQKKLITGGTFCPSVVVLGSSRTMLINSALFPGKTFFNSSVSGATLEDIVGIYELYKIKNCKPQKLVLGLDPWTLNKNHNQERWQSLSRELNHFLRRKNMDTVVVNNASFNKYAALVSPSYFQSSFKALFTGRGTPIPTSKKVNNTFTRLTDGSIAYDAAYRNVSQKQVNDRAGQFSSRKIYSIESFDELDAQYITLLHTFLDELTTDGIQISIVLVPYHPLAYQKIKNDKAYAKVLTSEAYFREIAARYHIPCHGAFDPAQAQTDDTCFYDGMHLNEKGLARIASTL